ncbi:hypothetical protein E3N88_06146 [Mikania micrantha]|uniref:Pectinesterase n=1 Tax=Mikania micrantha TaxID=192012 RepID=A0A5N6PQ98_9ASTR|nr:hypothetical protein E3N88_06146 [Mikania micrantha]
MSFYKHMILFHFLLILILVSATSTNEAPSSPTTTSLTRLICRSTPYPDVCFDSLKLSVSIDINAILIQSLKVAISEAVKLLSLLLNTDHGFNIIEKQKGTIQDCNQLHQITVHSLNKSLIRLTTASASDTLKLVDVSAFLAAAVTNKNTCLEGLQSASGPLKPLLVGNIIAAYKHVSNCLSLLSTVPAAASGSTQQRNVTNTGMAWLSRKDSHDDSDYDDEDDYNMLTVATDGSAVSGEGFLARDIGFQNLAGPEKHQAVALRVNADFAAVYRCTINGYQDTLYVHSFRQFYRECDIYGTIDYIFGNAAVVFQECNIISRLPMPGQFTVISAQSRHSPDQQTGISFQNCSVIATEDLSNSTTVKNYLGRPWKPYSRTVFIKSYIDDFIDPEGWVQWSGDEGLDTLYYGEYANVGPGSNVDGRVTWPGHHVMDYYEASNFTVSELITGQEWLDSTSFPYDDKITSSNSNKYFQVLFGMFWTFGCINFVQT